MNVHQNPYGKPLGQLDERFESYVRRWVDLAGLYTEIVHTLVDLCNLSNLCTDHKQPVHYSIEVQLHSDQ